MWKIQRRSASDCRRACVALILLTGSASAASLALRVSNEIAPVGGWAQVKISASAPALITSGRIVVNFDPAVFGPIANVAVFSAAGDAGGVAVVVGESINVTFDSASAGIGQLPELPVLTVTIPVLASAATGTARAITIDPSQGPWTDENGNAYTVTATPGSVTVGGSLSVQSLSPGGGLQAAGTLVRIFGIGFTTATTVSIAGVSLASTRLAGQNEIDVTLGGAADLTGKPVVLTNPNSSQIEFFSSLPSVPTQAPVGDTVYQPLLSMQTWTSATVGFSIHGGAIALQNPNPVPVNVVLQSLGTNAPLAGEATVTIPPGALQIYYTSANDPAISPGASVGVGFNAFSTLPIHIGGLAFPTDDAFVQVGGQSESAYIPVGASPTTPPLQQVVATPAAVLFNWQVGAAAPVPASVSLDFAGMLAGSRLQVAVTGPSGPFSVAATQLTLPATISIAVNPTGLSPGTYSGAVTITPQGPNAVVATIPLSLIVNASAFVNVSAASLTLAAPGNTQAALSITSSGDPLAFLATATNGTGPTWLSAASSNGITPAQVTVTANASGLTPGVYNGQITIRGSNDTVIVPVQFTVGALFTVPLPVTFSVQAGSPPSTQFDMVNNPAAVSGFSASTSSGGSWLSVASGSGGALITANPAGLGVGTYNGTVTATSTAQGPASLPVTLVIWNQRPVFTVSPTSITFTIPDGATVFPNQMLQVTSSVPVNLAVSGIPSGSPLLIDTLLATTPASIPVVPYLACHPNQACEYNVTITSGTQSVVVPVTTIPTTDATEPPFLGSIVNAASELPAAIAPGEILTIYGLGAGPSNATGFTANPAGNVATSLSGAQVLFNGQPAPMIYGSAYQANVIVPYEVANQATATIALQYGGATSGGWTVPVAATAPGIFTISATGLGQGAVLNQDNSVNSASNPAPRGSVIQIYATGEGQTSPPGITGEVIVTDLKKPLLPVTVSIDGQNAAVQYWGSAPDSVAGLLQVNAVVPPSIPAGSAIPIVVSVGGVPSQSGVTVAVQ
jgi:uncharacterized protein (TIGR03437 family)